MIKHAVRVLALNNFFPLEIRAHKAKVTNGSSAIQVANFYSMPADNVMFHLIQNAYTVANRFNSVSLGKTAASDLIASRDAVLISMPNFIFFMSCGLVEKMHVHQRSSISILNTFFTPEMFILYLQCIIYSLIYLFFNIIM